MATRDEVALITGGRFGLGAQRERVGHSGDAFRIRGEPAADNPEQHGRGERGERDGTGSTDASPTHELHPFARDRQIILKNTVWGVSLR
jgi:hypothetical protein